MKTPRLPPDTDLARIAPLPTDEKRRQLQKLKAGYSTWSYGPTRTAVPDLVNASASLIRSTGDTPLDVLEGRIEKGCRGNAQGVKSNLEVARLAYHDHRKGPLEAFQYAFGRYYVAPGESVAFWSDVYLMDGDRPLIPCYDFRRNNGLTRAGALFAASVMRLKIITDFEEFGDARLLLTQFPQAGSARTIRSRVVSADGLFSREEVAAMIADVRALWYEINDERTEKARKTGTGGGWWESA